MSGRLTYQLPESQTGCLTSWLVDWSIDCLAACQLFSQITDRLANSFIDLPSSWLLIFCPRPSVDKSTKRLIAWHKSNEQRGQTAKGRDDYVTTFFSLIWRRSAFVVGHFPRDEEWLKAQYENQEWNWTLLSSRIQHHHPDTSTCDLCNSWLQSTTYHTPSEKQDEVECLHAHLQRSPSVLSLACPKIPAPLCTATNDDESCKTVLTFESIDEVC